MVKRFFVRTRQLKRGMVIDQSIVDRAERVLIARGTPLEEYHIAALLKLGIAGVHIREGEEDPVEEEKEIVVSEQTMNTIQKLTVADRSKVMLTQSVKQRVSEGIQYLYSNAGADNFSDAANHIADDLMKAISDNDAIAVDVNMLKISDEYSFKHSVDVATIAMIVAKKYGMSNEQIHEIGIAGLLHDVGKSKIPIEVLNKPGKLTDDEFALMKQHTLFGYEILKEKEEISKAIKLGVLQHHEKINGKGYPLGICASRIHIYAKLLSVSDIYDALVTERPYKKAFSQRDAVEMIMSMTPELDITAIESFLGSVILYPVGSTVKLSNGESARVVKNNPNSILRPKVVSLKTGKVYNLSEDLNCANLIIE